MTELYSADEAFTTGTMGELTPILEADGRQVGNGKPGTMTRRSRALHEIAPVPEVEMHAEDLALPLLDLAEIGAAAPSGDPAPPASSANGCRNSFSSFLR